MSEGPFSRDAAPGKEQLLLSQTKELFDKCSLDLQTNLSESKSIVSEVAQMQANTGEMKSEGTLDAAAVPTRNRYEELQTKVLHMQNKQTCPVFTPISGDRNTMDVLHFGKYTLQSKFASEDAPPSYMESCYMPENYSTHRNNDQHISFLTSMIWKNGRIIVTDKANKKVKFFQEMGNFIHELLFPNAEPYGICYTYTAGSKDHFIVTFPKLKVIYSVSIYLSPTVDGHSYTAVGYTGITRGMRDTTLVATVVSGQDGPRVDLINYQGHLLRTFGLYPTGQPIFSFPRYVLVNAGVIIVSDWRLNRILFLREENGQIVAEYKGSHEHPLLNPYDITLDAKGNIRVLDGKTGHIHVVDRQCRLVDVVPYTSSLLNPRLLAYNSGGHRIAVSHGAGDIKIFSTTRSSATSSSMSSVPPLSTPSAAPLTKPSVTVMGTSSVHPLATSHTASMATPFAPSLDKVAADEEATTVHLSPESIQRDSCPSPGF